MLWGEFSSAGARGTTALSAVIHQLPGSAAGPPPGRRSVPTSCQCGGVTTPEQHGGHGVPMAVWKQTPGWFSRAISLRPEKWQKLGMNYMPYTWYIFLCLFWTFLTSRPFFSGALRGPGQNEYGEPLHAWDKRLDHSFQSGFFFMLLLWELMLHWLSGMSSDLHSCSFGKNVSRMRACVSGHVQTPLLYKLPPPKESWTVLLHGYVPVMFQQIIQNTLVI